MKKKKVINYKIVLKLSFKYFLLIMLYFGFFISFIYLSTIPLIMEHEAAHKEIYDAYGIKSEVKINYWKLSGMTYPLNSSGGHIYKNDNASETEYNLKCDSFCQMSHNFNETVGYHLMAFITGIWFLIIGGIAMNYLINHQP